MIDKLKVLNKTTASVTGIGMALAIILVFLFDSYISEVDTFWSLALVGAFTVVFNVIIPMDVLTKMNNKLKSIRKKTKE